MISLDKKYRYRNGDPARILCIDAPCPNSDEPVIALRKEGIATYHSRCGEFHPLAGESPLDLIECTPREAKLDRLAVLAAEREKIDTEIFDLEAELDAEEQP